jgi:hypothetical protein
MSFTRTLTLGRQRLFLAPKATRALLEQFGQSTPELEATLAKGDGYVDGLFGNPPVAAALRERE